jgi:hypothetical protein
MKATTSRRAVIAYCVIGAVVMLSAWAILSNPYRWLTTRQWLSMLPSGGFRAKHAVIAIRRTPKEQLFPVIRDWMTTTNTFNAQQPAIVSKLSIFPILSPERRRFAAYHALAVLGPEAKPFVPELKAVLFSSNSPNTFDAAFALLTTGSEGQAVIAEITTTNSEHAQFVKAATADMLMRPGVTSALLNWQAQSAEDIARLRSIFNLKCLTAKSRAYATSLRQSMPPGGPTNATVRGRRLRSNQPPPQ